MWNRQKTLEALRSELAFIEGGGYRNTTMAPWRATFMFEDSPTCMNSSPIWPRKPCTECVLIQFTPREFRGQRTPCRYIPLNEARETITSFYRTGTREELEVAVVKWLKATIQKFETEEGTNAAANQEPEVHVRAKFTSPDSVASTQERELHVRAKFIPLD